MKRPDQVCESCWRVSRASPVPVTEIALHFGIPPPTPNVGLLRVELRRSLAGSSVHPREVVRRTLELNAAALVLAHNHPSGVAEPSQADELITRRLADALALIDVRVLDHMVVAGGAVTNFVRRGLI